MALKVIHISFLKGFPGLKKQLDGEVSASREISGADWLVLGCVYEKSECAFLRKIPKVFQGVFRRNLFAWLWLLRFARNYDFVLVRHMPFDPFVFLFSWFVKNRIVIFHSKNEEELPIVRPGWKGWAASKLEGFSGRLAALTASGILGVTHEIAKYHSKKKDLGPDFPVSVYPNALRVDDIHAADDFRSEKSVEIGFMAGMFSEWHGLDLLVEAFQLAPKVGDQGKLITIHIIGKLRVDQIKEIQEAQSNAGNFEFVCHGVLREDDYRKIFARCHIGIGSLAMYRTGLSEGATLKVREMLAMGVPVYSGHRDTAIPEDFPYYVCGTVAPTEILRFAEKYRGVSRLSVREAARPYIEKKEQMQSVVSFLEKLSHK